MESFRQNNFTADLASTFLAGSPQEEYWLGLQAYNKLQTNTLEADAGHQVCLHYCLLLFVYFHLFTFFYFHFVLFTSDLSVLWSLGPKTP